MQSEYFKPHRHEGRRERDEADGEIFLPHHRRADGGGAEKGNALAHTQRGGAFQRQQDLERVALEQEVLDHRTLLLLLAVVIVVCTFILMF